VLTLGKVTDSGVVGSLPNPVLLLHGKRCGSGALAWRLALRGEGCACSTTPKSLEHAEARGLRVDRRAWCRTLYDMKTAAVTIRLDPKLEKLLDRVCSDTGRSRSEVVRDALRRQLTLQLFEDARRKIIPFAEAQGIFTDEDVFKIVS